MSRSWFCEANQRKGRTHSDLASFLLVRPKLNGLPSAVHRATSLPAWTAESMRAFPAAWHLLGFPLSSLSTYYSYNLFLCHTSPTTKCNQAFRGHCLNSQNFAGKILICWGQECILPSMPCKRGILSEMQEKRLIGWWQSTLSKCFHSPLRHIRSSRLLKKRQKSIFSSLYAHWFIGHRRFASNDPLVS